MGGGVSKNGRYNYSEKDAIILKEKVRLLQEEIKEIMCEREKESRSYERDIMVFTFKEAEWKQERKRIKEEVRQLRKMLEEREERIREMEEVGIMGVGRRESEKEWEMIGTKVLVEQMQEERERRDEAVEKWKQLYLAIKNELDDLIQRTYDGDGLYWKAEEDEIQMENLKNELQEKEETIKALKVQLALTQHQKHRKEREFDLLRQSLRIINGKKNSIQTKDRETLERLAVMID